MDLLKNENNVQCTRVQQYTFNNCLDTRVFFQMKRNILAGRNPLIITLATSYTNKICPGMTS